MGSDFINIWNDGFADYAIKIAGRYKEDPERELKSLGFKSILDPLLITYTRLVNEKEIPKLEDLNEDHKKALWLKSKQVSNEHFKRIAVCKAIYLLETLTRDE